MRILWIMLITTTLGVACSMLIGLGLACADSVLLKNGRRMSGKVVDNRQTTGDVLVEVTDAAGLKVGTVTLHGAQVEKIDMGEPRENTEKSMVRVKLSKGSEEYGTGEIEGVLSPESDDKMIVLETAGGGTVRIPRSEKVEVVKVDAAPAPAPAPAAAGGTIKTTHEVLLLNGGKLSGTLVPTPDTEPLKLKIGSMGTLTIPRSKIAPDGVKEVEGTIVVPEDKAVPAPAPGAPGTLPEEERARLKEEIKAEILRELLDEMIERKLDAVLGQGKTDMLPFGQDLQSGLTNDEILEVQDAVRELSRQRTQNRVRAERHLKNMGPAVLPYLEAVAGHPFELTRRAVQRIVRDLGDPRGASIAIEALNDPDDFVRSLARDALEVLLPSDISYDPTASEKRRREAQDNYRLLWDELLMAQARESVLRGLAAGN
jgi:hypothetical protein